VSWRLSMSGSIQNGASAVNDTMSRQGCQASGHAENPSQHFSCNDSKNSPDNPDTLTVVGKGYGSQGITAISAVRALSDHRKRDLTVVSADDCWKFALKAIRQDRNHETVLAQLFDWGLDAKRAERYVRSAMIRVQRGRLDAAAAKARKQ
jgi:hypothetical protein